MQMRPLIGVILLLITGVALAEEDQARVAITGRVVAPKRSGLSVWLNGGEFHTLTTKSGNFTFVNVAAGVCDAGGADALPNSGRLLVGKTPSGWLVLRRLVLLGGHITRVCVQHGKVKSCLCFLHAVVCRNATHPCCTF
jgi:hypothetical protein